MKLCKSHEDRLRAALAERGLAPHIQEIPPEVTQSDIRPDPLMGARYSLVRNLFELAGAWLLIDNSDGSDRCPMCYVLSRVKLETFCNCSDPTCTPDSRVEGLENWIDKAADEQLRHWNGSTDAPVHIH